MPIVSRKLLKNNTIKGSFNLPIKNGLGSLTITKNFQDYPSASITYEGVTEQDISRYEQAYDPYRSKEIILEGIPYRVAPSGGYSYNRTPYLYQGSQEINVYSVTINLESWWKVLCSNPIKIKTLINLRTGKLSASKLARRAGVLLRGGFEIFVDDVDSEATMSLNDVLSDYALVEGCYINYGNCVELKKINSGSTYSFDWAEQISDGSNQLGVAPYYNGTVLSWTPRNKEELDSSNPNTPPELTPKDPELKTEYEYDEDVTNPPRGTILLRSLDSNLDQSGPKKVRRTTYTIDGQVDREVVETWGFAYYLRDFKKSGDYLVIDQPGKYWKKIEHQETKYNYQKVDPPIYEISAPSSNLDIKTHYQLVIHPDYEQYIQDVPLLGVRFIASNAEYLTSITTSGWKLGRFQQEEPGGDTDTREMTFGANGEATIPQYGWKITPSSQPNHSDIAERVYLGQIPTPWWGAVKFQQINRYDKTEFYLKSMRADYEQDAVPYSIEWVNWQDIDPELQRKLSSKVSPPRDGTGFTLKVGLITADLDFVEPMLVWTESRQATSIATMAHPDSTKEDPLPALVTGEESYYQSIWTKKNDEYSVEKIIELTASGAGFVDGVENIRYREIQGRPPGAQYRKQIWEEKKPDNSVLPPSQQPSKIYYLYSDLIPSWAPEGGESISFNAATSLDEALTAAETQLRINTLQSTQEVRTISWYTPSIEGGDFCNFSGDRFRGRFRVLSVSTTFQFDGSDNIYGIDTICTTDGMQLTLGSWDNRSVRVRSEDRLDNGNQTGNESQGETPKEDKKATIIRLGGVLPATVPNRRN